MKGRPKGQLYLLELAAIKIIQTRKVSNKLLYTYVPLLIIEPNFFENQVHFPCPNLKLYTNEQDSIRTPQLNMFGMRFKIIIRN